ncbi:MAG: hypothetical protein AAGC46_08915, partial [Solirubrobacteraceae bacterium]
MPPPQITVPVDPGSSTWKRPSSPKLPSVPITPIRSPWVRPAVMQTPESLHRVARECVEDLAADAVVYAEVRFAPELHINRG